MYLKDRSVILLRTSHQLARLRHTEDRECCVLGAVHPIMYGKTVQSGIFVRGWLALPGAARAYEKAPP